MPLATGEPFLQLPKTAQWALLVALSFGLAALLKVAQFPAALLLGSMIAAIVLEIGGGQVRVPPLPFQVAQAVIGCMVAHVITGDIVARFLRQWPIFLGVVSAVIAASCLLAVLLGKLGVFPNTTAIWGLLPGAAATMMLMAEAFGADVRLVAFMQYLRVGLVALTASLVARLWVPVTGHATSAVWFPEVHWPALAETLALIALGVMAGRRLRFPAAMLLVPMVLGAALQIGQVIQIELPPALLAASYLLLGWNIGLRFTRAILAHAIRVLPQTIMSIVILIAFGGLLAWLLVRFSGVEPLTAYLATSPGGADSITVIAASSKVDFPFVMSLQIVRFLMIMLVGPPISRWLAGWLAQPPDGSKAEELP